MSVAVVTGAAGHLGANLVRALLTNGVRVRAIVRTDTRGMDGLDVDLIQADVRDEEALRDAFAGADVVYHLAARIAIDHDGSAELEEVNVGGTRTVVTACRRAGVGRLVHFSSVHALVGRPRRVTVNEQSPLADRTSALPYDRTKALAEREVAAGVAAGLDAVVVSPTGALGPFDFKPSHMGEAMLAMYHRTVPALVRGGFDWVDARDVARTAMAAAERGRTGERYLIPGRWASVADVARTIAEVTGAVTPRFAWPMTVARIAAPVVMRRDRDAGRRPLWTMGSLQMLRGHRHVQTEKAAQELGHRARPLRETIEDTFAWFAAAGMLERR